MEKIVFAVGGMSCQRCVQNVIAALRTLPGVQQVDVDLDAGQASVTCDPGRVSVAELRKAVEEAGFDAG